jgi:hypothetical protein
VPAPFLSKGSPSLKLENVALDWSAIGEAHIDFGVEIFWPETFFF